MVFAALFVIVSQAVALERPLAVAGGFYPADPKVLRELIDRLLAENKVPAPPGTITALIVPHAGLVYSGAAAATAFNAIDPGGVGTILMLGSAHYVPVAGAALYPGDYATPLGRVEYDPALASALLKASDRIQPMPEAHEREHSIEVNVPFIQRRFPQAKLVALVMNAEDLATAREVGEALAKAASGRKVLVVASSDLSHYPPGPVAERVDPTTLQALRSMDPAFFHSANRFLMAQNLPELKCTWCGEGSVTAVLAAARALGAGSARVLKSYHSGSVVNDAKAVVGYAAVAFLKGGQEPRRGAYGLAEEERAALLAEARGSLRAHLAGEAPRPVELSTRPAFNLPAAVFVTLETHGPSGAKTLRGCIGSTAPQGSLLGEVRRFAVEAGVRDPRFRPMEASELEGVHFEVSILSPHRRAAGPADIRPREHGVIVEQGGRAGLFLPQVWDVIPEKKDFLGELCSQKAGLPRDCASDPKTRLSVFTVESFSEL